MLREIMKETDVGALERRSRYRRGPARLVECADRAARPASTGSSPDYVRGATMRAADQGPAECEWHANPGCCCPRHPQVGAITAGRSRPLNLRNVSADDGRAL